MILKKVRAERPRGCPKSGISNSTNNKGIEFMSDEAPKFEFIGPPIQWQNDVLQDILIEGNRVQVHISMEALQDAMPELSDAKALVQFSASRDRFMAIALREVAKGNIEDGKVLVKTEHL
jgi:hypothetical protein